MLSDVAYLKYICIRYFLWNGVTDQKNKCNKNKVKCQPFTYINEGNDWKFY